MTHSGIRPPEHQGEGWGPACMSAPKLTPQQHDEIRTRVRDGEPIRDLAAEYRVSTRTIRRYSD